MKSEELNLIYETVLASPGMLETVKIDLKIPRKNVLMLVQLISGNLDEDKGDKSLIALFPAEAIEALKLLSDELLNKSGLTELNAKLKVILK